MAPDDHVNIGFHEVLLHDMGEEDLPFVALSELDCLRNDWPQLLFVFMSRYQHDRERMRRECKDRFCCMRSGNCTVVNTYRQIWASTLPCFILSWLSYGDVRLRVAQDCVDHLRWTHEISQAVKAANLARYFPPWTVTRSQWTDMTRPAISGVAIDTLLFSRIGLPLFQPLSDRQSCGDSCGLPRSIYETLACLSGRNG